MGNIFCLLKAVDFQNLVEKLRWYCTATNRHTLRTVSGVCVFSEYANHLTVFYVFAIFYKRKIQVTAWTLVQHRDKMTYASRSTEKRKTQFRCINVWIFDSLIRLISFWIECDKIIILKILVRTNNKTLKYKSTTIYNKSTTL